METFFKNIPGNLIINISAVQTYGPFYIDTTLPAITNNQTGDDTWRNSGSTAYNVDFSDATSYLANVQYKITTATGQGGTLQKDWTDIASVSGSASYTTDWTLDFVKTELLKEIAATNIRKG